ncbi:MAG: glycosyltransferase family 2 protein [Chitinophagaceae bacterium]|nr:glycosyltransferase family 2 protein [Chitinophagaceae bacterium]
MDKFSIVIVAKDSADKIGRLLKSTAGLTDDIIVCDTGSMDNTIQIAKDAGASVFSIPWEGYGKSKNAAIQYARHQWILSLDSDEKIDSQLYTALQQWQPANDQTVYQVLWKNFLAGQWIRHSDWGNQWKKRLFNKNVVHWDDAIAHEDVTGNKPLQFVKLDGYLEHYSFKDTREYATKMIHSAMITAEKYHHQGRSLALIKLFISPPFSFVKSYIIKLGFLDGHKGWLIAVTNAYYTFIKYARLNELNQK